jgi:hypothetical protein
MPTQYPARSTLRLVAEVLFAPVVIVEESDAVGRALGTILAAVGPSACIAEGYGSTALLVLYEASLILVWFGAGPAKGVRDAAEQAARTVAQPYFEDVFQDFVERRQRKRRGRRRRERDRESE